MPRSFLVKKYFSNKKPNYSELESQTGECAFKSCLFMCAIVYKISMRIEELMNMTYYL